jgi:hypothetical protein
MRHSTLLQLPCNYFSFDDDYAAHKIIFIKLCNASKFMDGKILKFIDNKSLLLKLKINSHFRPGESSSQLAFMRSLNFFYVWVESQILQFCCHVWRSSEACVSVGGTFSHIAMNLLYLICVLETLGQCTEARGRERKYGMHWKFVELNDL